MPDKELYTIKDLARKLDVGESTVRFWRDRFSEFIPSVTQGKRKLYREEALEALRFIQQETNRSKSAEQIRDELSRQQPIDVEPEKSQRSAAAPQQWRSEEGGQEIAPQVLEGMLERVRDILQEQNRRMESIEAENRELRDRLARLEEREQTRTAAPQPQITAGQSRKAIISYIKQLRAEGKGYTAIASQLNREGIPGLRGGTWHAKTAYNLLKKEGA